MKEILDPVTTEKVVRLMAHEIRNSLVSITNTAYLIKMELAKVAGVNPKTVDRMKIIEKESREINRMITTVVDYYKNETLELASLDLNDVVREALAEVEMPPAATVNFAPGEPAPVMVSLEEMKRALKNLIENARDSLNKKPGAITLTVSKDASSARVEIRDTGEGVEDADLAKIVQPFFSSKTKGMGLGLPAAKRIVEDKHGGTLKIESAKGTGTTVVITVPLMKSGSGS